jgi:hypothetical protein
VDAKCAEREGRGLHEKNMTEKLHKEIENESSQIENENEAAGQLQYKLEVEKKALSTAR